MSEPSTSQTWPSIEPGASLLVAYQLTSSHVVLVGGGLVAAGRLFALLAAGAQVTLISPFSGLCPEVVFRLTEFPKQIIHLDRNYESEADLDGAKMVLTAIDDPDVSAGIGHACRRRGIPVNVADVPPLCDFYFGAIVRRGALQVLISTGGKGPRLAHRLKKMIENSLPAEAGEAIENVGELRKQLRKKVPGGGVETISRRMGWMVDVCDKWSLAELASMDDAMRASVLEGWESGKAKGYREASGSWVPSAPRCPVKEGPDGRPSRCPFLLASSGFLLGVATVGAIVAVRSYAYTGR